MNLAEFVQQEKIELLGFTFHKVHVSKSEQWGVGWPRYEYLAYIGFILVKLVISDKSQTCAEPYYDLDYYVVPNGNGLYNFIKIVNDTIEIADIEKTLLELLPMLRKDLTFMISNLQNTVSQVDSIVKKDIKYKHEPNFHKYRYNGNCPNEKL